MARVKETWQLPLEPSAVEPVSGGQESLVLRVDDLVVRIGPAWRSTADAGWCYELADQLGKQLPTVVRPFRTPDGATVARLGDRPVSVWPWIDAELGDRERAAQRRNAAATLAQLHAAAASLHLSPRPPVSAATEPDPTLADPALDAWLAEFRDSRDRQALHGDFYPGNLLFDHDQVAGIVDWDEAVVDCPEVELAMAACEWGDLFETQALEGAIDFVETYRRSGGPAAALDHEAISQLYRARLRWELEYEACHNPTETLSEEDRQYRNRQIDLYFDLRP